MDYARAIVKTIRNDAKICTRMDKNRLTDGSTPDMVQSFLMVSGK
jgi:hypothetical protein